MMANRRNYEEKLTAVKKRLNGELKDPIGLDFRYFILAAERILYYCDSEVKKYGLNRTQLGILNDLMSFYGGTATPSELSNRVMRSKHATTKAVDTLDKLGLARSNKTDLDSKEKGDRRLRKISITEKGLEILERTIPQRNENASLIMQCFDAREAKAFSTSLQTLVQHLEQLSLK